MTRCEQLLISRAVVPVISNVCLNPNIGLTGDAMKSKAMKGTVYQSKEIVTSLPSYW